MISENFAILKIIIPLSYALQYIHNKQFIHRDIKPENIVVKHDWTIKLCDFGLACNKNDLLVKCVGTHEFMAPELVRIYNLNDYYTSQYDERVDIWAFGCLIFELLIGINPFTQFEYSKVIDNICNKEIFIESPKISMITVNFIKMCLIKDYHKRPFMSELLLHPLIVLNSENKNKNNRHNSIILPKMLLDNSSLAIEH